MKTKWKVVDDIVVVVGVRCEEIRARIAKICLERISEPDVNCIVRKIPRIEYIGLTSILALIG